MKKRFQKGLTLIEILVVASITALLVVALVSAALKTKLNITEVAQIIVADIRQAQANAISAKQYIDPITGISTFRCGYGLRWLDSSSYQIYVGTNTTNTSCSQRQFNNAQSTPILTTRILDDRLEVVNPTTGSQCVLYGMPSSDCPNFKDTYFEAPRGKIYIRQQHQPNNKNNNRVQILIKKKDAPCPSKDCAYICIYSFGVIEQRNTYCPKLP